MKPSFFIKYRFHIGFLLFLTIFLFIVYAQIGNFGVLHNDDIYLIDYYTNIMDLSVSKTFRTLFITPDFYVYYSPMAKLFYLLDMLMYGRNIGWYRYTHVILHGLSALFIFSFLYLTTRAPWRSMFAAALFAFHPLNSEAVATFYARVNPLSGFLGITALLFYCRYAARPSVGRYLPVLCFIILALLAKPSAMVFAVIFLLLDFWPLKRVFPQTGHEQEVTGTGDGCRRRWNRLVITEKIPIAIICLAWFYFSSWYYSRSQFPELVAALQSPLSLTAQLVFIPVSFVAYILKTFYPAGLPSYTSPLFSGDLPIWRCLGSIFLVIFITGLVLRLSRKRPYLITGWFWFMAVLGPHLPILVSQKMLVMERFAYIPLIGLFIMITWAGADILEHFQVKRSLIGLVSGLVLFSLAFTTWYQTGHRKDAISFYRHAVAVFPGSSEAHSRLGELLLTEGLADDALHHFNRAVRLDPDNAAAYSHLGDFFAAAGRPEQAVAHYRRALEIKPDYAAVHNNLGNLLVDLGKQEPAIAHYRAALALKPQSYEICNNLATALISAGRFDQAELYLKRALLIKSDYQTAKENLQRLLALKKNRSAIAEENPGQSR